MIQSYCRKTNVTIGTMVDKILNEKKCSIEVALAGAISAKNRLQNNYGFSPNQLVFEKNPNLLKYTRK